MTFQQAHKILDAHNKWRRGETDDQLQDPRAIGQAIDLAVLLLENEAAIESAMDEWAKEKEVKP